MALSSTTFANLSTKQFSHHCTWALFNQFLRTKYILLLQKLKSMQYVNDSADPIPEFVPSERKPGNAHVIEIYSQTSVQSPPRRQRKVALWEGGVQWNTIPICCFPRGGTDQPRSQDLYPQAEAGYRYQVFLTLSTEQGGSVYKLFVNRWLTGCCRTVVFVSWDAF